MIILASFGQSIIEFGKYYGFNIWDWSAVLISFCSVIIACLSLFVATKTLKSQQKTEKNTLPIINDKVQLSLLGQNLRDIYDTYTLLFALDFILDDNDYKIKVSSHFWHLTCLNENNIHESLFYSSQSKFFPIHQLNIAIKDFNNSLLELQSKIESNHDKSIDIELSHLYDEIGYFISLYTKVLSDTFNLSTQEIKSFLTENFYNRSKGKFVLRYISKYLQSNDSSNNIICPCINDSRPSFKLKNKYLLFYELSKCNQYCDMNKKHFMEKLSREVDLVLMFTIIDGAPIDIINTSNISKTLLTLSDDGSSNQTNDNKWHCSEWVEQSNPKTISKSQWIFYVSRV